MISKKIWIPIYSYRIWYIEVEGPEDLPKLLKFVKKINLGEENIKEINKDFLIISLFENNSN